MGRGGRREGAGRKPGPRSKVRHNRVVILLTDAELKALQRRARQRKLPMGTLAYELVAKALRRGRGTARKT